MNFASIRLEFRRASPPPTPVVNHYRPEPPKPESGWDMIDYAGASMLVGVEGAVALGMLYGD